MTKFRAALTSTVVTERWRESQPGSCVEERRTAGPSASPDFLLVLVALAGSMRLSLMKAAHVAVASATWQEMRVAPTARRGRRDDKV
jgi:hypothetical protein